MTRALLLRLTGAALTIGGIALATFIHASIPDKTLLHLAVTGVAAVIAVIGIGIYEDASSVTRNAAKADTSKAEKSFASPHAAL